MVDNNDIENLMYGIPESGGVLQCLNITEFDIFYGVLQFRAETFFL